MPRMTGREKLVELEARQRRIGEEIEAARQTVRAHYGAVLIGLAVERLTERELRDLVEQALRTGAPAAIAALKALPALPS